MVQKSCFAKLQRCYQALKRLGVEEDLEKEGLKAESLENEHPQTSADNHIQPSALVIKEHDFQQAKNSLMKYTEQAKNEITFTTVPTKGGLFKLFDYTVTGNDLNDLTKEIQGYLISMNKLNQGVIDEFRQVYKAFESLDRDYITGIVASIKAAEKVSLDEQKDRKDIKRLIQQHELSVEVLKKFKQDIEELNHILDVDKIWDLVEEQTRLSSELSDYINGLSQIQHLNEVDALYIDAEELKRDVVGLSDQISLCVGELKTIQEYCEKLANVQHLEDVDDLWERTAAIVAETQSIKTDIENQTQKFSVVCEKLQKQILDAVVAQTAKLENVEQRCFEAIETFSNEQTIKFNTMESELNASLDSAVKEQTTEIEKFILNKKKRLVNCPFSNRWPWSRLQLIKRKRWMRLIVRWRKKRLN